MPMKVSEDNQGAKPTAPFKGWVSLSSNVILIISSNSNNNSNNNQGRTRMKRVGSGNNRGGRWRGKEATRKAGRGKQKHNNYNSNWHLLNSYSVLGTVLPIYGNGLGNVMGIFTPNVCRLQCLHQPNEDAAGSQRLMMVRCSERG